MDFSTDKDLNVEEEGEEEDVDIVEHIPSPPRIIPQKCCPEGRKKSAGIGSSGSSQPLANYIEELSHVDANEKEDDGGILETKAKKAKKDPMLLRGNMAKADGIITLRGKWKCPKKTPQCMGGICYIGPEFDGHFPMGHEHIDCWASYSLKEDPNCLLKTPPNHHLFPRSGAQSHSPVFQLFYTPPPSLNSLSGVQQSPDGIWWSLGGVWVE
ncbi:hypothetical protein BDQ17DRAFT_1327141 [Cyathus striatus]|nr:hypothetical protein BDQ17DRAFT_1327141 [Cyathus striatus]